MFPAPIVHNRRRWCKKQDLTLVFLLAIASWGCSSPAAPAQRRSVLLITVDTLRADHVNATVTPALDRLAREAVRFETAVTVSPITLPSHASLLTGVYPPAHGVRDNQIFALDPGTPTYTAWFKAQGYTTAAFVSAIVLDRRYGLDTGFDSFDDQLDGRSERNATETLTRAVDWLDQHGRAGESRSPFFLWIHLFDPHAPYLAGSYASEVSSVDAALGRFFETLRSKGIWDELVLSVTSDHGESLGEHGESTHGFFVYDATVRIPWILKAPGLDSRTFAPQVRILDVLPTVASLSRAGRDEATPPFRTDGVDLTPFLARNQSPRLEAYSESYLPLHQFNWSELRALRTERLKYIEAPEPELYDLSEDPAESRNVLGDRRGVAAPLQSTLAALERQTSAAAHRPESDPLLAERFMSLGYIGYSPTLRVDASRPPDPKRKLQVYELTMSAFELAAKNRPDDAVKALRRAEALDSNVTQVHYLIGTILGQQGRYGEAAAALERAVRLNPRYLTAQFKLALAYLRLERHDKAERALQVVLDNEPRNVRALHNMAAIAYSRGDLQRAERLERDAIAIDPKYFDAWNTLGAIYVLTQRSADAIEALRTALQLDPKSGQAHHNLALALRATAQQDAAREAARTACALDRRFCS